MNWYLVMTVPRCTERTMTEASDNQKEMWICANSGELLCATIHQPLLAISLGTAKLGHSIVF